MGGERCARFGAVGDIVLSGRTASAMKRHGYMWPFEHVAPLLRDNDVLFGNLECALLPDDFPPNAVDPRGLTSTNDGASALRHAGFDVVSLANNHILDGGTVGMLHTAEVLRSAGIAPTGVGRTQEEARRPTLLNRAGLRWAFLSYAEDSNYTLSTTGPCHAYYEQDTVLEDIAAVRDTVDVVVVSVHADLEFLETPSPARRAAFRAFAEAGATVVLGHHPHVSQGMERVGSSLVVYSLGNFVSHAHSSPYLSPNLPSTAETFVLVAEIGINGVGAVTRRPVIIGPPPDERPAPAHGRARSDLDAVFERLDAAVTDDALVASRWRAVALERAAAACRSLGAARDSDSLVFGLGNLIHVAENRAWVDELLAVTSERWDQQRAWTAEHQRPSYSTAHLRPTEHRPRGARAIRRAGKLLRDVGRSLRAALGTQ